jgi:hypothetical protein
MFTSYIRKKILKNHSSILVPLALAFSSCSEVDHHFPEEEVFSEVGEPILEQPVSEKIIALEEAKLEGNQETNASKAAFSGSETTEIIEGEIVLGQTLLSTDYNESAPIINNLPPHDPSSKYKPLAYSALTEFPYEIDWELDGVKFDFSAYASRVPRKIRNLSGKTVALEGFMVPTVVDEQNRVKEFLLMPDQLSCCFGQAPEANGWVVARSEEGVDVAMDRVIRVLGTLTVQERWDEEFFVGLYHVECDEMFHHDQ